MANEPDLDPGTSSAWVSYLQQLLNQHYQQSVVTESGTLDDETQAVLRHLRAQRGLPDSAGADAGVWAVLVGETSEAAPADTDGGDTGGSGGSGGAGGHDSGNDGAEGHGGTGFPDDGAEAEASTDRYLTVEEVAMADAVFGGTLATDAIVLSEGGVLAVGGYARTLPDHITFPAGALSNPDGDFPRWLVHELGHCWQYQQGAGIPGLLMSALGADYDFGGPAGLRAAAEAGQAFGDFGYEEQASIFAAYYAVMNGGDTSAYEPYLKTVWDGTWRSAPTLMCAE